MIKKISLIIILILLVGCQTPQTVENKAKKVAQDFAIAWDNGDYSQAYDYFVPELKNKRSQNDFVSFVKAKHSEEEYLVVFSRLEKIDNNTYNAFYSNPSNGVGTSDDVKFILTQTENGWKINGFDKYFVEECMTNNCKQYVKQQMNKNKAKDIDECMKEYDLPLEVCKKTVEEIIAGVDKLTYTCNKDTKYLCTSSDN